ncbi:hypothetical protein H0H81_012696 [Sphagnurus paluster]|uniref:N-acetyltransferase domain-containing protein n=1 Tax=Sphagnurus paluster TaxID=117069 RepID=A0A9P7GHV2_9AGAR|nr:hypothetical protein H0H81_012696 [Sphagnurus paluster]
MGTYLTAHPPTPVQEQNGVRIRYFRKMDSPAVRDLFLVAIGTGPGSPREVALKESLSWPLAYLVYALSLLGLATLALWPGHKTLGFLLTLGVPGMFLRYRHQMSRGFMDYCYGALRQDLADIAGHYGMEPVNGSREDFAPVGASAFWVVECTSRDGRGVEIVGCIGLGAIRRDYLPHSRWPMFTHNNTTICGHHADCGNKDGELLGELRRMAVSPHCRRMGIGALLVQTLIDHAKVNGVRMVLLSTTEYQRPAIRMYLKHGWVESHKEVVTAALGLFKVVMLHFRLDLLSS